jgi:hypothetical protein
VEHGTDRILDEYALADNRYKIAVLETLAVIGGTHHISFALGQLHNDDNGIKAAAAKCLSALHPQGYTFLQYHALAGEQPWKAIFMQIKNDRAA